MLVEAAMSVSVAMPVEHGAQHVREHSAHAS